MFGSLWHFTTKYDRYYYKMWQFYYKNVTVITKCNDFVIKYKVYYKMRWYRCGFLDQVFIFDICFLNKMLHFLVDLLFLPIIRFLMHLMKKSWVVSSWSFFILINKYMEYSFIIAEPSTFEPINFSLIFLFSKVWKSCNSYFCISKPQNFCKKIHQFKEVLCK